MLRIAGPFPHSPFFEQRGRRPGGQGSFFCTLERSYRLRTKSSREEASIFCVRASRVLRCVHSSSLILRKTPFELTLPVPSVEEDAGLRALVIDGRFRRQLPSARVMTLQANNGETLHNISVIPYVGELWDASPSPQLFFYRAGNFLTAHGACNTASFASRRTGGHECFDIIDYVSPTPEATGVSAGPAIAGSSTAPRKRMRDDEIVVVE